MEIKIFGQLKDVFLKETIRVEEVEDINELKNLLNKLYPGLSGKSFVVAVNRKVTHENISLENDAEIALLPPFSGG